MLAVSALVEGRDRAEVAALFKVAVKAVDTGLTDELIFRLFRVRSTEPGVGKYLKRWGLAFQRPDKRAVGQDAGAVRVWHEETSAGGVAQRDLPAAFVRGREVRPGLEPGVRDAGSGFGRTRRLHGFGQCVHGLPPLGVALQGTVGGAAHDAGVAPGEVV